MDLSRAEIRSSVGLTLRRMRRRRQLSLDDVEQLTGQIGLRVTRSHLSRVETGSADIALPRLLALLRALGEPAAEAATDLDALLDPELSPPEESTDRAERALEAGDPACAARILRPLAGSDSSVASGRVLDLWGEAESRIGCWALAERAFRRALGFAPGCPRATLRLAVASVGSGSPALAGALASASPEHGTVSEVVRAASDLASDRPAQAAERSSALLPQLGERPRELAVSLVLLAEAYSRSGQPRAGVRAAERAVGSRDLGLCPTLRCEALLALARAQGACRRPASGLKAVDLARRLARQGFRPALLARAHAEARRLWNQSGDRREAQVAARSARAVQRRLGSDRTTPAGVPLHSLLELTRGIESAGQRAAGKTTDAAPPASQPA